MPVLSVTIQDGTGPDILSSQRPMKGCYLAAGLPLTHGLPWDHLGWQTATEAALGWLQCLEPRFIPPGTCHAQREGLWGSQLGLDGACVSPVVFQGRGWE